MLEGLGPYASYRPSGVTWLGDVPKHWEIRRLKNWVAMNREVLPESTDPNQALTYLDIGSVGTGVLLHAPERIRFGTAPSRARRVVRKDDTILSTVRTYLKAIYHVPRLLDGLVCSTGFAVLSPKAGQVSRYVSYVVQSSTFTDQVSADSVGIAYPAIAESKLGTFKVPVPPPDEQRAIVRFLDHADRKIRRYIRAKQKLIKLLEEQKQAIIHRAVTGQIDVRTGKPYPHYKPSGVEWLGDLPDHWELRQLRRIVRLGHRITYGIVQPGELDPSGRFMVRGQDYSFGWGNPESIFRVSELVELPYKRSRLDAGDLVFTIIGAGVGNVAIVPNWLAGANITQTSARISVDPGVARADYIKDVLKGPIGRRNIELYVKGAAQPGLNLEHVRIFLVPVPPLGEQASIVAEISSQVAAFDETATKYESEIRLLGELQLRLIADVVTGKLDVRRAAEELLVEEIPESVEAEPLEASSGPIDESADGNTQELHEDDQEPPL